MSDKCIVCRCAPEIAVPPEEEAFAAGMAVGLMTTTFGADATLLCAEHRLIARMVDDVILSDWLPHTLGARGLCEPSTARPRLRIERADCPNHCSKCDEAWSLIATSEDGHEFEIGWIRTGNDDTESRGVAARIVEMWNSGREKP